MAGNVLKKTCRCFKCKEATIVVEYHCEQPKGECPNCHWRWAATPKSKVDLGMEIGVYTDLDAAKTSGSSKNLDERRQSPESESASSDVTDLGLSHDSNITLPSQSGTPVETLPPQKSKAKESHASNADSTKEESVARLQNDSKNLWEAIAALRDECGDIRNSLNRLEDSIDQQSKLLTALLTQVEQSLNSFQTKQSTSLEELLTQVEQSHSSFEGKQCELTNLIQLIKTVIEWQKRILSWLGDTPSDGTNDVASRSTTSPPPPKKLSRFMEQFFYDLFSPKGMTKFAEAFSKVLQLDNSKNPRVYKLLSRLPDLFDLVDFELESWKSKEVEAEQEQIKKQVIAILERVQAGMLDWQRRQGITRLPSQEHEPFDATKHTRCGISPAAASVEFEDYIHEIERFGYWFGVDLTLRKAEVVVYDKVAGSSPKSQEASPAPGQEE